MNNTFFGIMFIVFLIVCLMFGSLLVWRLGPDGYSRTQAHGSFAVMCDQIKQYHPDFVCPAIGR